jgi:hypothetical protein
MRARLSRRCAVPEGGCSTTSVRTPLAELGVLRKLWVMDPTVLERVSGLSSTGRPPATAAAPKGRDLARDAYPLLTRFS